MNEYLKLPNGVRIVYEKMPYMRSASVGIFVGVGSRYEKLSENGSAHFIEHMLFKSTERHSAEELAYITDGIGGQINAYTTREQTCFYAKVLDSHLKTAIELLCEMFFECSFDERETESERGVIIEEIGMYADTPEDECYERMMAGCFKGALGRPVLGTAKSLGGMTGASLREYKEKHYTAGNIVISLCGNFEDCHIELLKEKFSVLDKEKRSNVRKADYSAFTTVKRKRTEQNQFCLGFPSVSVKNEDRYAMDLMNTAFGGGVSSRLFQNIREKHGLCYTIYSFQSCFADTGMMAIATGVNKETELRSLSLIADEIRRFVDEGVGQEELDRAREQAKSSIVMGMESTSARMLKLGNSMLIHGKCRSTDEIIALYDAVTCQDILRLARERFDFSQLSLSALGKTAAAEEYKKALGL